MRSRKITQKLARVARQKMNWYYFLLFLQLHVTICSRSLVSSFAFAPVGRRPPLTCRHDAPLSTPDITIGESADPSPSNVIPSTNHLPKTESTPQRRPRRRKQKPQVFKHLFRHNEDISVDCWLRCAEPREFLLSCGYTGAEIDKMAEAYPQLLSLDVHSQLAPKMKFIVHTLGGGDGDLIWAEEEAFDDEEEECNVKDINSPHTLRLSDKAKSAIPPEFFGARLERHIGPRHAYLQHFGLPSGNELLMSNGKRFKQFLGACSTPPAEFAMLAMKWAGDSQRVMGGSSVFGAAAHSASRVDQFEQAFRGGLLAAAKREHENIYAALGTTSGQFTDLLLSHGANYLEPDRHGASPLAWACSIGNLSVVKSLLNAKSHTYRDLDCPEAEAILSTQNPKDGATPLHWAACGVYDNRFGSGGHESICHYLLTQAGRCAADLANAKSWTNNTPLMFAVWAKSLDVAKLLISYGADPHHINDKGCHTAHWATAGGDVEVCNYLHEQGVDFYEPDSTGHTPLHHAISYGQDDVVKWMLKMFYSDPDKAAKLLQDEEVSDFLAAMKWAPDDEIKEILLNTNLFEHQELADDVTAPITTEK